jgi:phage N-6-adenine-methyltransferase
MKQNGPRHGRGQPKKEMSNDTKFFSDFGINRDQSWKCRRPGEIAEEKFNAELLSSETKPPTKKIPSVHFSSQSFEWYTPPKIIYRVVRVLGAIDLDPCSDDERNVPAKIHFTQAEDGLRQHWVGNLFMNPPYGRTIAAWVQKLIDEYDRGSVTAAIALVPARTDTIWFRKFRDWPVCFIAGRLRFSGHENSAPFPSALVYLGEHIDKFNATFSDVGDVWVRWRK